MDSELSLRKAQLLSSHGLGFASLLVHSFPSASHKALTLQTLLKLRLPSPPLALLGLGAFMSLRILPPSGGSEVHELLGSPAPRFPGSLAEPRGASGG